MASLARATLLALPLAVPPLQYPQCPEGVPAAGRAKSFQLEVGLALVAILKLPAAIIAPRASDDVNRLGNARIAGRLACLEIIEGAKDIVVPARREGEANEDRFDDLARAMGAEEPMHQEELAAQALGGPHGGDFAP